VRWVKIVFIVYKTRLIEIHFCYDARCTSGFVMGGDYRVMQPSLGLPVDGRSGVCSANSVEHAEYTGRTVNVDYL